MLNAKQASTFPSSFSSSEEAPTRPYGSSRTLSEIIHMLEETNVTGISFTRKAGGGFRVKATRAVRPGHVKAAQTDRVDLEQAILDTIFKLGSEP